MKAQLTQEAKNALIEAFNIKSEYAEDDAYLEGLEDAVKIVESFPTSDEGRWIPVSERLPEAGKTVLIVHEGETVPGYRLPSNLTNDEDVNDFDIGDEVVSAELWQPLPNPPNKRSE